MKVCFSGTFNVLHKGHKRLIDKAFQTAGESGIVYIGITNGAMLKKKKNVKPFDKRAIEIKNYLSTKGYEKRVVIKEIFDKYGPIINGDYDIIIVSPETFENAKNINIKRIENGKKSLKIIKIDYVLADDNKPISSTRILNKEIDGNGKAIK